MIRRLTHFLVNDKFYYTNKNNMTLLELIMYFNHNHSLLVLELNGVICTKDKWYHISINHHDKIEIVTIVGGG